MENKQRICDLLAKTLKATYNMRDLETLDYDPRRETVTAKFESGHKKVINVALDSGTAMIKDIILYIGV